MCSFVFLPEGRHSYVVNSIDLEEGAGVGNASLGADASTDMQAKQFNTWNFDDEEEEEKQSYIWE